MNIDQVTNQVVDQFSVENNTNPEIACLQEIMKLSAITQGTDPKQILDSLRNIIDTSITEDDLDEESKEKYA